MRLTTVKDNLNVKIEEMIAINEEKKSLKSVYIL